MFISVIHNFHSIVVQLNSKHRTIPASFSILFVFFVLNKWMLDWTIMQGKQP